ncbi:MAG: hypothetical protein A2Z83_02580 [Omnitrophica bacterium GWA2_52_8]|nr:MAG: hypothetical protein A2Z83_02580 [Omnitrophica bacterium GWA2_52_8]
MKFTLSKVLGMMLVLSLAFGGHSFADENEVVALKEELKGLKDEIAQLKGDFHRMEADKKAGHGTGTGAYVAPARESETGLIHTAQDINMGGYVDVQFNNNFNQPEGTTGTNTLRVFDTDDGSFTVNSTELWFEKAAHEIGEAGFRIDLQLGEDADVVNADNSGDTGKIDLQQAYVEYIAGLGIFEGNSVLPDRINIKAGRFATLAGLEVIESPDNWTISRSVMFGFGLPFTHTGVRTNFGLFDNFFDVYFGVNNGWDQAVDQNSEKTMEWGLGYDPLENVNVFHAIYLGQERPSGAGSDNEGNRFLWTNVVTWDATDALQFAQEFNYGTDRNRLDTTNVTWYGTALNSRYQFTDKFAMAYRFEWFHDNGDTRTTTDSYVGNTFTAEYKLNSNLLARGEVRWDRTDEDRRFAGESSQVTVGGQMIYLIG